MGVLYPLGRSIEPSTVSGPIAPHVQTVLGAVGSDELGISLIHEHLFINLRCYWEPNDDPEIAFAPLEWSDLGRIRANPFASRENLVIDEPSVIIKEAQRYREAGGRTIVDVTPASIGRDARALRWVAEQTGLNVIAGTGYYIQPSHPPGVKDRTVGSIAEELIEDLAVGIDGTGIRAGVIGEIGVATSPMHHDERKVLLAAAAAQKDIGCAIIAHSAPGVESPFEVASILNEAGALLDRVVQSHLDERFRQSISDFKALAKMGVNFGLDTFGRELYFASRQRQHPTDETRVDTVIALLEAGLIDHVLLAQDICLKHELSVYGGYGYDHILRSILPRLRNRGVSEQELDRMTRINPARVLTGSSPAPV